jgi:CYTH domain-containing protein
MENWEKPNWMGEEITGVGEYSNIKLAKKNLMF